MSGGAGSTDQCWDDSYELVTSGRCDQPIEDAIACEAAAQALSLKFKKSYNKNNKPGGCVKKKKKVYFNANEGKDCKSNLSCICMAQVSE